MRGVQRIIKYFAIVLAIFIIIVISSIILFGFNIFSDIWNLTRGHSGILNFKIIERYFSDNQMDNIEYPNLRLMEEYS